uniref:Uncharacterized protein n=1 Tax=Myotis myotis TaxID=51298 RepID=A0A7J7U5L1_MYOMY|nr:hypothetical protein mMyoMyo1_008899 [Myotis myotis]
MPLTGNQAHNLGTWCPDWESNLGPLGLWDDAPSTEHHGQAGAPFLSHTNKTLSLSPQKHAFKGGPGTAHATAWMQSTAAELSDPSAKSKVQEPLQEPCRQRRVVAAASRAGGEPGEGSPWGRARLALAASIRLLAGGMSFSGQSVRLGCRPPDTTRRGGLRVRGT